MKRSKEISLLSAPMLSTTALEQQKAIIPRRRVVREGG